MKSLCSSPIEPSPSSDLNLIFYKFRISSVPIFPCSEYQEFLSTFFLLVDFVWFLHDAISEENYNSEKHLFLLPLMHVIWRVSCLLAIGNINQVTDYFIDVLLLNE